MYLKPGPFKLLKMYGSASARGTVGRNLTDWSSPRPSEFFTSLVAVLSLTIFQGLSVHAHPAPSFSGVTPGHRLSSPERCASRAGWGQHGYSKCAPFLPSAMSDVEGGWVVAVHVDRAPTVIVEEDSRRGNLRARTKPTHRELPHQYFVHAMQETLFAISEVDPGARVNVAVFTEGWGGMVDEMGVPILWDIPQDICEEVGLDCLQVRVMPTCVQFSPKI